MAHVHEDRVLESSTSTGTGAFTLAGAVSGFLAWSSAMAIGDTGYYSIEAVDANGNPTGAYEQGIGTYSAANTLTRTTVLKSSNANALVSFAAGTKHVYMPLLAKRTLQVDEGGAFQLVNVGIASSDPAQPPTDRLAVFSKDLAPGDTMLRLRRATGGAYFTQPLIAQNGFRTVRVGSGAVVTAIGTAVTAVGTVTHPAPASTRRQTAIPRASFATAGTAGSLASLRCNQLLVYRGDAIAMGGFRYVQRITLETLQVGMRGFFGLQDSIAAATNVDPLTSTAGSKIGIGFNLNTGNWRVIHNVAATAPTTIDLGTNFPINATDVIELTLFTLANSGTVSFIVTNVSSGQVSSGALTTNIPANTTFLAPYQWLTNNATAAIASWGLYGWTLESDY